MRKIPEKKRGKDREISLRSSRKRIRKTPEKTGDSSIKISLGQMLRTGEASRLLNIHSNTLRRWSEQGLITAYRVGPRGDRRYKREDIAALLIEKTVASETDESSFSPQ